MMVDEREGRCRVGVEIGVQYGVPLLGRTMEQYFAIFDVPPQIGERQILFIQHQHEADDGEDGRQNKPEGPGPPRRERLRCCWMLQAGFGSARQTESLL